MEKLGDKNTARSMAIANDVPVVPGSDGLVETDARRRSMAAREIGFPVLIKATAGGGGKGMRVAEDEAALPAALSQARTEAEAAFGNGGVYMERFVGKPRHIEVQVIADQHGNVCHLFERDCSVQRRHQKLIEEAPSPNLPEKQRQEICEAAVRMIRGAEYSNAGTVEFIVDSDNNFFFIEVNARIQVEHPVSEMITGVDLIKEQIRVAAGEKLSFAQQDLKCIGHAIECRINAEDPDHNFQPKPGQDQSAVRARRPGGPIRLACLRRIHRSAKLRFDDRQVDCAPPHASGSDRDDATGTGGNAGRWNCDDRLIPRQGLTASRVCLGQHTTQSLSNANFLANVMPTIVEPFALLLALLPLIGYLVVFSLIRLSGHALVTTGGRELAALAFAVSGMVVVGPIELFFPRAAATVLVPKCGLRLAIFYCLCVTLIALTSRPKLVVYGRTPAETFGPLLAAALQIDPEASGDADTLQVSLPASGVRLRADGQRLSDYTEVLSFEPNLSPQFWNRLISGLRRELERSKATRPRQGYTMLLTACVLTGLMIWQSFGNQELVVQGFKEWLWR